MNERENEEYNLNDRQINIIWDKTLKYSVYSAGATA